MLRCRPSSTKSLLRCKVCLISEGLHAAASQTNLQPYFTQLIDHYRAIDTDATRIEQRARAYQQNRAGFIAEENRAIEKVRSQPPAQL